MIQRDNIQHLEFMIKEEKRRKRREEKKGRKRRKEGELNNLIIYTTATLLNENGKLKRRGHELF